MRAWWDLAQALATAMALAWARAITPGLAVILELHTEIIEPLVEALAKAMALACARAITDILSLGLA